MGEIVYYLFGKEKCRKCKEARSLLAYHKIPYTYYNLESADGLAMFASTGVYNRGSSFNLPVLMDEDFNQISIEEILKREGKQ